MSAELRSHAVGLAAGVSLLSGAIASLAFPPQNAAWLAWLALVPWLICLDRVSIAGAARVSAAFALGLCLPLGAWIPATAGEGFGASTVGAYGLWLATSASFAPAIVVLGVALRWLSIRSPLFAVTAGAGWGLVELSFGSIWPTIPYVTLGATQIETPLAGLAAWIGVHGVSAIVVAASALVAQAVALRDSRPAIAVALLGAAVLSVGRVGGPGGPRAAGELRVALVQPAVPLTGPPDSRFQHDNLEALVEITRKLLAVDLVLWPENALTATLDGRPDLAQRVARLSDELGTPIVAGAHRGIGEGRANSIARFTPGGVPEIVYDKVRLLPLAEWVPGRLPVPVRVKLGRLVPPIPFTPGERHPTPLTPSMTFSLCFESAFSGEAADPNATLLVNLVHDGWYDRSPAAEHLLLLSRWRAIEAGAPLLRAATTGISAIVTPDGAIAASLPIRERGAIVERVPLVPRVTGFERVGYAPLYAAAVLGFAPLLTRTPAAALRAFRRSPRGTAAAALPPA